VWVNFLNEEGDIMLDKKGIQEKYNELYKKFFDKQIDDFDAFIRSRIIEYCLNKFEESSDQISNFVLLSLDGYVYDEKSFDKPKDTNHDLIKAEVVKNGNDSKEKSSDVLTAIGVASLLALTIIIVHRLRSKK
jgi:hypothetical protein